MTRKQRLTRLAVSLGVLTIVVAGGLFFFRSQTQSIPAPLAALDFTLVSPASVQLQEPQTRTVDVYRGLGAWVDGFDYSPAYANNGVPDLAPIELEDMAAAGVETLYLQSGRLDDRSPDVLEDRWVLAEFLMRAEQNDIAVVAWYLPKWTEDDQDLAHLMAAHNFEVLGYRFDGVAVDIEWNQDGLEISERNDRFIRLSRLFSIQTGADPIGAIVLPPVQTEVINPTFWPSFPWQDIKGLYDVWLPMSYWSFRTEAYGDGYTYNAESVQRLRDNLGDPDALVHPIGGIGGQLDAAPSGSEPFIAHVDQLERFAQSLVDTAAIGGSVYDWMTLDDAGRAEMAALFETGIASSLGDSTGN